MNKIIIFAFSWIFSRISRWFSWDGIWRFICISFTYIWSCPAIASATVHFAEILTTAAAGTSHLKFKMYINRQS